MLRVFLKARSEQLKVAPKLIASTADLDALAGEEEPNVALLKGWRREVFGEDALKICAGQLALAVGRSGVEVIALTAKSEGELDAT